MKPAVTTPRSFDRKNTSHLINSPAMRWPGYIAAALMLLFAGNAYAVVDVGLSIQNDLDGDGNISVIDGSKIRVSYSVIADTDKDLHKNDTIELLRVSDDSIVDAVKRGKKKNGIVSLKVKNSANEQLYVRYRQKGGGPVISTASHPTEPGFTPLFTIPRVNLADINLQLEAIKKHVMLCGDSGRDIASFVPGYPLVKIINDCSPNKNTIAMLVTRHGIGDVDATDLQNYLNSGGSVVGEFGINDDLYNMAFGTAEVAGALTGSCSDSLMPQVRFDSTDPIWESVDFVQPIQGGCGFNMQDWVDVINGNITKVGGWAIPNSSVSLAYRNLGLGRLWLVEIDWQDGAARPDYSGSRQIFRYMLTH